MNPHRREELLALMPPEAPYLTIFSPRENRLDLPREVEISAKAHNDPAFGHHFICAFLALERPLPAAVTEEELIRSYHYLRSHLQDRDVQEAFALEARANRQRRILLRCHLLQAGASCTTIAEGMGLSEDTVHIYATLFWDVRGRDRTYVPSLVFPNSRQVELYPGYALHEDFERLSYRLALDYGMAEVELWLGLRAPTDELETGRLAEILECQILGTAVHLARVGFVNQNLPVFKSAMQLIRRRRGSHEANSRARHRGLSLSVAVAQSLGRNSAGIERLLTQTSGKPNSKEAISGQSVAAPRLPRDSSPSGNRAGFLHAA